MRRVRLAAFGVLAVAFFAMGAGPASAHATLKETTPGAGEIVDVGPSRLRLQFDEPVKTVGQGVRVFGPDGERVDAGRSVTRGGVVAVEIDASDRGTYTVAWRVVSDDGHNLSGSFVFHLGTQTGAVDVSERVGLVTSATGGVGRFGAFAAVMVVVGAAALAAYSRDTAVAQRLRLIVLTAAAIGCLSVVLILASQAARATGQSLPRGLGSAWDLATNTRTGQFGLLRAGAFAAVAVLAGLWRRWRSAPALFAAIGVIAMIATSLSGHPWSTSPRPVAVLADVAHQSFAAVWVGGLVALLLAMRVATDRLGLVYGFSRLALACAIGVLTTGSVSGYLNVRSADVLLTTGYGQLLVAKVVGFGALLAIGWANRRRYIPLIAKTIAPLTRSVRVELAVVLVVLALTAGLVNQPPAANAVNRSYETTVVSGEASLLLQVTPARAGLNDVHMYFYDKSGLASYDTDAVEVTAAVGDVPARKLKVTPVTASHQSAYGASLPRPGEWEFRVTALRAGVKTVFVAKVRIK